MAQTQCLSISTSFSDLLLISMSLLEGSFFSIPSTTPSVVFTPIAVDPNYIKVSLTKNRRSVNLVRAYFDCFNCVLNLVYTAFRRESVDSAIVLLFSTLIDVRPANCKRLTRDSTFLLNYFVITLHSAVSSTLK